MFDGIRVNTLTAEPLLKLLIAMEGREPSTPDGLTAWQVWKRFLTLPPTGGDDASFQVVMIEGPDARICQVHLTRQLTDAASGIEGYTIQVVIQFDYQVATAEEGDEGELWRSDFKDDAVFFGAIERTRGYRLMMQEAPMDTLVYMQETEEQESYYGSPP